MQAQTFKKLAILLLFIGFLFPEISVTAEKDSKTDYDHKIFNFGSSCINAFWPIAGSTLPNADDLTSPFGIRYDDDDGYDFHEGLDIRIVNNSNQSNIDKVFINGFTEKAIQGLRNSQPRAFASVSMNSAKQLLALDFEQDMNAGAVATKTFITSPESHLLTNGHITVQFDDGYVLDKTMARIHGHELWIAELLSDKKLNSDNAEDLTRIPTNYVLNQNYPNPFNPTTEIQYSLPQNGHVTINIFNVWGQKIRTLLNERKSAGSHRILWDAKDDFGNQVASGVYIYRIRVRPTDKNGQPFASLRKMTLLR